MLVLLVILGAIATWRSARMLLYENGPFEVFRKLRIRLGVRYHEGDVIAYKYEITTCMWCLSVWVGAAVALVILVLGDYAVWVLLPYVFSAFASLMNRWIDE